MYIINFAEIAYHQNEVLYIIKSQRNTPSVMIYTLKRDDIRFAAMIYQVCDLDKKILQKRIHFLQCFFIEATKKIFFAFFNKVSNSNEKSRRRRVYHQGEALYITNGLPLYIIIAKANTACG